MTTCLLITTFNRTPLLRNSLERLTQRTLPDEVLIVDDGGSDGCDELCWAMHDQLPITYLFNHSPEQQMCSKARNLGIRSTAADLIITSEPELLFDTDVIAQMLQIHQGVPHHVISAGTVRHMNKDGTWRTEVGWVAPFTALYGRQWLLDIGGWDEHFPEPWGWDDTDLLTRLRLTGHGQVIENDIHVTHQWHEPGWRDQVANETHFKAKGFDDGNLEHLVANR